LKCIQGRVARVEVMRTEWSRLRTDCDCLCFVALILWLEADSRIACRAYAVPMPFPCHAVPLIHTCHAAPLPCSDSAVSFVKVRVVAGNI
jgi:hypothetical protein